MTDKNQKLPDLANNGTYPYVDFYQFRDGSWHRQDSTPGSESLGWGHKTGSYHEFASDGSWKHFSTNTVHNYNQGGTTSTTEGNHHTKIAGSSVKQTDGDHHSEHGGTVSGAVGQSVISVSGASGYQHAKHGNEQSSSGDTVTAHDGSIHHSTDGDSIEFISGVRYEHCASEKGSYVEGNYDIKVNGNYQLACQNFTVKASGTTTINAQTVTIKTAAGDIMVESSGKITLKADGGDIDLTASGKVNIS